MEQELKTRVHDHGPALGRRAFGGRGGGGGAGLLLDHQLQHLLEMEHQSCVFNRLLFQLSNRSDRVKVMFARLTSILDINLSIDYSQLKCV